MTDIYPKFFWRGKGEREAVAIAGRKTAYPRDEKVYGLSSFDGLKSDWFVPTHTIDPFQTADSPKLLSRHDLPTYDDWMKLVETALREISRGSFQKVVLARITQLQFSAPISPWPLLHKLLEATQETTIYGFQPSPHEAFIGATPENLYKRKGTTLLAESIAGTRKRGSSLQEDLLLERDLLASEKEQREFHFVKNFIEHQLSSVCQKSGNESVKVIKTARVQHLYHQYNGQLFHPIDDRDLMKLLHPTPAVGGFSREEALTFLKTHEPFDRGWYAGPIGWMSQEEAHIAVAIRSAHVQGSTLTLHAGTGIVSGSDPRKEWDELEWKIAQMMDLL